VPLILGMSARAGRRALFDLDLTLTAARPLLGGRLPFRHVVAEIGCDEVGGAAFDGQRPGAHRKFDARRSGFVHWGNEVFLDGRPRPLSVTARGEYRCGDDGCPEDRPVWNHVQTSGRGSPASIYRTASKVSAMYVERRIISCGPSDCHR